MNFIIKMIMGLVVTKGLEKGIDLFARRKTGELPETEEDKIAQARNQKNANNAKKMMRMGRRFTRF